MNRVRLNVRSVTRKGARTPHQRTQYSLAALESLLEILSSCIGKLQSSRSHDAYIMFVLRMLQQLATTVSTIDAGVACRLRERIISHECDLLVVRKQYVRLAGMVKRIRATVQRESTTYSVIMTEAADALFRTGQVRQAIPVLVECINCITAGLAPLSDAEGVLRVASQHAKILTPRRTALANAIYRLGRMTGVDPKTHWKRWLASPQRAIALVRRRIAGLSSACPRSFAPTDTARADYGALNRRFQLPAAMRANYGATFLVQ